MHSHLRATPTKLSQNPLLPASANLLIKPCTARTAIAAACLSSLLSRKKNEGERGTRGGGGFSGRRKTQNAEGGGLLFWCAPAKRNQNAKRQQQRQMRHAPCASSQCSQQAALWTAEMGDERRGRKKANRH
jgi:hypothetical protein